MTTVVIGAGVAGLVAARRLARGGVDATNAPVFGRDVLVLEAAGQPGGRVGHSAIGGIEVDTGAESFATRGGDVAGLLAELGLADDVVDPSVSGSWLALPDRIVPMPATGVLGIPGVPLATDVVRVLGRRAAARAYADRLKPVLHQGRYGLLGPLVRERMGSAVVDRLVAPIVQGVYGAHPDEVRVDDVLPTLNGEITRAGSLSGAVLRIREQAPAGSAVQGIVGGVHRLVSALADDAGRFGVRIDTGRAATGIDRDDEGRFVVRTDAGPIVADAVLVATDGVAGFDLLGSVAGLDTGLPRPEPKVSGIVTLLLEDPALDAHPRGTGVLVAAGREDVGASAVTHASAKWGWVGERLGPGRHLVRVFYPGSPPASDAEVLRDLGVLMGAPVRGLRERVDAVWVDTAPSLDPATAGLRRHAQAAVEVVPGLGVTGSWITGTGLARIVGGADRAALQLGRGGR